MHFVVVKFTHTYIEGLARTEMPLSTTVNKNTLHQALHDTGKPEFYSLGQTQQPRALGQRSKTAQMTTKPACFQITMVTEACPGA